MTDRIHVNAGDTFRSTRGHFVTVTQVRRDHGYAPCALVREVTKAGAPARGYRAGISRALLIRVHLAWNPEGRVWEMPGGYDRVEEARP
jgi:hypothetical protein